jgi:hypothetical protein
LKKLIPMTSPHENNIEKNIKKPISLPTLLLEEIHIYSHGELVRREV